MASYCASARSKTFIVASSCRRSGVSLREPSKSGACHPIVETNERPLHGMTETATGGALQDKGKELCCPRSSCCRVSRSMSSEPQAGILEVANEHGGKTKVVEGSSAVQHGGVGRTDDTCNVEDEKREPDEARDRGGETQGLHAKNQSMMSAFRDFFLAAFSDSYSYQDHYGCCGTDTTYCTVPHGGKHVSPEQDCLRTQNSSRSYHDLEPSASHDSSRKRRKKPLAIAVGFNYANDMNGRPVVITRGASSSAVTPGGSAMSRRPIPGDLQKMASGGRPARYPPSESTGSSSGSRHKQNSVFARFSGTNAASPSQRREHGPKAFAA